MCNSREQIAIQENKLSNLMERITNSLERIAQFKDLLLSFFENPHIPSGPSYCSMLT